MKTATLFLTLLMYIGLLSLKSLAQDFAPGQQAQGMLESKNVTGDPIENYQLKF